MIGWQSHLNWTRNNVKIALTTARLKGEKSVSLDVEHSDRQNELDIIKWAEEMGYKAELKGETVVVLLNDNK